jgi:putative ABC transport system permease protein
LPSILPADFPRVSELTFDPTVVVFTAAVAILSSVAFGLLPALRMRSMNVAGALAAEGVSPVGVSARSGVARTRLTLIVGQVAVSCVLLVAAVLLGRTFILLMNADRGFNPSQVMIARLSMTGPTYSPERRRELIQRIVGRLTISRDAAFTSEQPLTPGGSTGSFTLPPRDAGGIPTPVQASPRVVSARYFSTLGTRVLAGRAFDDSDTETSQAVAVVNDAFAREYLAGNALGVKIPSRFWGGDEWTEATIVGIVEDVQYIGGPVGSQPEMYFSDRQLKVRFPFSAATLLVGVNDDVESAARDIRAIVRDAHEGLVAEGIMTLEDRLMATSLARPRVYAVLLGSFAALGLLLTGVGLFAVLSHVVAQRTRELGVRAALGASRIDLIWLVMGQGLAVTAAGLVVGLSTAALLARLTETLLYGVSTNDASTYVVVAGLVLLVAMIACLLPALRAARLDPLRALRA